MDVLGVLKKKLLGTRKFASEKAKIARDMFKLREQIRSNKKEIRTLTYKIGQTYIDLHSEDCEDAFADYVRGILEAKEELAEKEQEFKKLKEQAKSFGVEDDDDDLEDFFDDDDDDDDDDEVKEPAAPVEEVKEEVEAAAEEAEEIVSGTAGAPAEAAEEAEESVEEAFEDAVEDIEE